jgi:glycine/D-amino acid oxidase-like deaminating enzyme
LSDQADVVVVGAGVLGCAAAYWLGEAGLNVTVVERDRIGAGASGMSAATFPILAGLALKPRHPDQTADYIDAASALFREVASRLSQDSGIDVGFRDDVSLSVAFNAEEAELLASSGYGIWLGLDQARRVEPRLGDEVVGALQSRLVQVLPLAFCMALSEVAKSRGVVIRSGEVASIGRTEHRITGVRLTNGEFVSAGSVVLATGPWTAALEPQIGLPPTVYPVRGQVVVLQERDSRLSACIWHGGSPGGRESHLLPKADGTILAGGTKEHDSGFDVSTTQPALDDILRTARRMVPSIAGAKVVDRVAGLRPGTRDGEPLVGEVPDWPGLYLLTGHYHFGVGPSLLHGRIVRDLIVGESAPAYAAPWDPARLADA